MEIVWAAVGGFLLGLSIWFPYKFILNKLVASKRETSSILNELGMNEKEHAQFQQEKARNSYQWQSPYLPFTGTTTPTTGGGTYTSGSGTNYTATAVAELNNAVSTYYEEKALATLVGQYGNASTGSGTYASSATAGIDSPGFPDTSDTHQEDEQQQ